MTTCSTTACGTGLGSVVLPGDPNNNSVVSATPAFGGIDVSWSLPTTNAFAVAHTKIYRGVLDNFNSAVLITVAGGNEYFDKTPGATSLEYFYWIQFVSVNGTIGDLIGPASAVARPTIEQVIEQLTDQIDYGTLATALKAKIDDVTLNYQELLSEVTGRLAAETIISQTMLALQTDVDNALLYVNEEITARQDGDSALVQQINTVAATSENDLAVVQQTLQASIGELGALYHVKVGVNGLVGGFGIYNDGTSVEAGFDVDTFWVGRTGPDKKKPFIISGGEVFISQAVIQNASITTAKIADAAITAAKIGSIALTGVGNFSVKSGATGQRMEMDSQVIKVFDSNGTLRVKLGNLSA